MLRRVAVVGPCAADPRTFMGCYAFPNHVLPRYPDARARRRGAERRRRAARRAGGPARESDVVHEPGLRRAGSTTGPASPPPSTRPGRPTSASRSSATSPGSSGWARSGEGCDADDLRLPGVQADLLDELLATGTPVVVVVVSGRPYALGDVAGRAAGLVQAFMPGEEGGRRDRRRPLRPGPARRQAARADPALAGRPARHLPAAAARCRQRRHQQPRPDPAVPLRPRPLLHHLRRRRPAAQRRRGAHRRRVRRVTVRRDATPARGRARRSSSSTCTTSSPR